MLLFYSLLAMMLQAKLPCMLPLPLLLMSQVAACAQARRVRLREAPLAGESSSPTSNDDWHKKESRANKNLT
jgi:hypothetical protein